VDIDSRGYCLEFRLGGLAWAAKRLQRVTEYVDASIVEEEAPKGMAFGGGI